MSAWPLIALLALVDTIGYVFVYAGLAQENGEFAIVTSSAYSVVTIMLARIFLREQVVPLQWLGVHIVIAGIGDGARSRDRTGTAFRPADFTYHYSFRYCAGFRPAAFVVWTIPLPYALRALRQEPSSLYTFPAAAKTARGLARDYQQSCC